jgi:hypothetical protein
MNQHHLTSRRLASPLAATVRSAAAASLLLLLSTTGCQVKSNTPPEAVNEVPLTTDPAMVKRDWPQQSLMYDATGIDTWPTRYYLEPKAGWKDEQLLVFSPVLFIGQSIAWPVAVIVDRPFNRKDTWRGETILPTFSAAPPLTADYIQDTPPATRPATVIETVPYHQSRSPWLNQD